MDVSGYQWGMHAYVEHLTYVWVLHLTDVNILNVFTLIFCSKEYFSQHLGEYENVLGALEDLNMSILKAMDKTKKVR